LKAKGGSGNIQGGGGGRIRLEYRDGMSFTGMISVAGGEDTDGVDYDASHGSLTFTNNTWPGDWNLTGNIGLLGGDYGEE